MSKEEAVRMLQVVAARGFASAPVRKRWSENEKEQYVVFTEEEKAVLRAFLGENLHLACVGRKSLFSFLFCDERKTLSLLERMVHAMDSSYISPVYVSALAVELAETSASLFEVSELNRMMTK